jgi:uncharacterized membrane protein
MESTLRTVIHLVTRAVELGGIAIIVLGMVAATTKFLRQIRLDGAQEASIRAYRTGLGHAILLGLEFLVAADIINTVAIEPSLTSVAVLAGIVLIRTLLSFSLEVEIEGHWPWQRTFAQGAPRQ